MNKRIAQSLVLASVGFLAGCMSPSPAVVVERSTQDDLKTIMTWWQGDYSNVRQLDALSAAGKPIWRADDSGEGGHIEVVSHYQTLDLPQFASEFGSNVIYVEETKHGDPAAIFRQRVYTLRVDPDLDSVRVTMWVFKDKKKFVGAWNNPQLLATLTPEDVSAYPPRCDMLVKREDERYHMAMRDKACVFGARYFNYQVLLGAQSFWFRDKIMNVEDDTLVSTAGEFTYHELDRL